MTKKYRIRSKFRFTLFLSIIVLIIGITMSSLMGLNDASGDSIQEYMTIVVADGDTLWSIAEEYNDGSRDIRALIHEISVLNEIKNAEISAGQELIIPV